MTEAFERCLVEPQFVLLSVPPQSGKTESAMHGLVWLMQQDPTRSHAYVSYEAGRAEEIGAKTMALAARAALRPEGNRSLWRLPQGGQLAAAGIGGALTGRPVSGIIVVDDPHKNREEANSALMRRKVDDWYRSVALTRVHPQASVLVVHTRWHEDDLIGRLSKELKEDGTRAYQYINLPAVDPDGNSFCEWMWPTDKLKQKRAQVGEFEWAAMYMGRPLPIGGGLFKQPATYTELPTSGVRYGIGVDLAYSAKTSSDYSVAVVCARAGDVVYIVDVVRVQMRAPEFEKRLEALKHEYPTARWRSYVSGVERGVVDFMHKLGSSIGATTARGDKFTRAQPVAAAWNAGEVQLPKAAPWVQDFVDEICCFTGVGDRHDDQVDALSAAFDVTPKPAKNIGGVHAITPMEERPLGI